MTEHLAAAAATTDRESTSPTPSPLTNPPENPFPTRFDKLTLEDLLNIVNDGKDKDGVPLGNNDLDAIQVRIALWRRLQKEAEGARNDRKRRDRDDDNDENTPAKRIDIKYDEVDSLTLKSSFRAWTDWKADLERVWAGAPWKYERDTLKVIKAVSKMDKACRARWNAHVRINPTKDNDYSHFLGWTRTLVRNNVSFETTVYEEYEKASQRDNQSPMDFDAYLSSIERELPEVPDSIQANRFYAKLNEDVVKQIKISGLQALPDTRTEMVALAQRVWEGLRPKQNRHVPMANLRLSERISQPDRPDRHHRRHDQPHHGHRGRWWSRGRSNGHDSNSHRVPDSKDSNGKLAKDEQHGPVCYSCGQAGHKSYNCPNKKDNTKLKPKVRVQQVKLEQRIAPPNAATSDDESSGNE